MLNAQGPMLNAQEKLDLIWALAIGHWALGID
jgi:hypothetical protein